MFLKGTISEKSSVLMDCFKFYLNRLHIYMWLPRTSAVQTEVLQFTDLIVNHFR